MPNFILRYPEGIIEGKDFYIVGKTIREKGNPLSISYVFGDKFYEVDLTRGTFNINGVLVSPADGNETLTGLNLQYRPIWKIFWVRVFNSALGETGNKQTFLLGWQITLNDKNYQRVLQIHETGEIGLG